MLRLSTEWDWRLLPQYNFTNLQYALDATTPTVPITLIPKSPMLYIRLIHTNSHLRRTVMNVLGQEIKTRFPRSKFLYVCIDFDGQANPSRFEPKDIDKVEDSDSNNMMKCMEGCFTLSDFWDSYEHWSSCGAGVPVKLPNGEAVMQYYWPSLSAFQLFTRRKIKIPLSKRSATKPKTDDLAGEETIEPSSETDEITILGDIDEMGDLCCQYNDIVNPYGRPPLTERVESLIDKYPQIVTLKSSDLTSHSWVAIAWYPVYRVPISTVKELNASFMTFHRLSSVSPGAKRLLPIMETEHVKSENIRSGNTKPKAAGASSSIFQKPPETAVILPFAMSTYKMSGDLWFNPGTNDLQTAINYQQIAWRWIKDHGFKHHDFNFFMSRGIRH